MFKILFMPERFTNDPSDEILILTTRGGKPIGQARRKECHKGKGKTHWGLLAIIKRRDGKIILAKRSSTKSVFANIWDASVATHVLPGDTPEQAATRETKEELGVDVSFKTIAAFYYQARDHDYAENEYCSLLIGFSDEKLKPHSQEVSQIAEVSFEELQKRIKKSPGLFSPWLKIALKKFAQKLR